MSQDTDRQTARRALAMAGGLEDYIVALLRDLIAIPSLSCDEGRLAARVESECVAFGIPVRRARSGSVIATLGHGPFRVAYDAHMDTVGPGDPGAWAFDPYAGKVEAGRVFGRGASDNKGALAAMIAGLRIAAALGLADAGGWQLDLIGVVEEEVAEGWAIGDAIQSGEIDPQPHCVVLGECTNLGIARGHRGRCEFDLETLGTACHGSSPWRGHNALYDMAAWVRELQALGTGLQRHGFLGPASLAVTRIHAASGSPNVVPERCTAVLDWRTLPGDTADDLTAKILAVGAGVKTPSVRLVEYAQPSYTGLRKTAPKEYPAWEVPVGHSFVRDLASAVELVTGTAPVVGKWEFSTDGVMTMGRLGIPTIGFGPGEERFAHTVEDQVDIAGLVAAAAVYAIMPGMLVGGHSPG